MYSVRFDALFFFPHPPHLIPPSPILTHSLSSVAGASYRSSFWTALRIGTPVTYLPPYAFTVALDGYTVYSTVPPSSAWTLVLTPAATAVTATSNKITMTIGTSGPSGDSPLRSMAVTGVTLVGPVSFVSSADAAVAAYKVSETAETSSTVRFAKTKVVSFGWGNWEGLVSTTTFADMTGTFGAWSVVTTAATIKLVNKAFTTSVGNYIVCACYPYGHTYGLAMYTTNVNNEQQSVQRTYTQLVVGGNYSVSFWYAKTGGDDSVAPTNFQVTLGGTPVWSTAPTSKSWVRSATAVSVSHCVRCCCVCQAALEMSSD